MSKEIEWPYLHTKSQSVSFCELCVHQVMLRDEADEMPWCDLGYDAMLECKNGFYHRFSCKGANIDV